ncbi:MAG: oligopeptide:H+ symporter [Nannocystaceae bacterium]|nr:oligopeptide:H+ symporter [Nannocystaceae bacterium]
MTPAPSAVPPPPADGATWWGHPRGLFHCFFTELWERFSFYGMKALLFFYLTKYHGFDDARGYLLIGTYGGLAYALPVLGGVLADRHLGMRKAVVAGGVLLALGHCGMVYEGHAAFVRDGVVVRDDAALQVLYLSLSLIIVGVGLLKPNVSTIVGRLYAADDPRRDSGFTLFYLGINVGAFASSLVCGWLGETYGWGWGFGAAGIGMLAGLVGFLRGQPHLHGCAEPPDPAALRQRGALGRTRQQWIALGVLATVIVVWRLLQAELPFSDEDGITATELVAVTLTLALTLWLARVLRREATAVQRDQMLVLCALTGTSVVFWTLYEQSYGSWNAFSDRAMDRHGLGIEWTAAQLTGLGSLFIFALSPVFAWLWPALARRGRSPSTPAKFGWALVCAGLATWALWLGARLPGAEGLAGLWSLVLAYLVIEVGEMMLSPIGLSAVTTLSLPRIVSLMMGTWFLASAFGEILAGRFGTLAAMPADTPLPQALSIYASLFGLLGWIGVGAGAVVLLLAPRLARRMHGA